MDVSALHFVNVGFDLLLCLLPFLSFQARPALVPVVILASPPWRTTCSVVDRSVHASGSCITAQGPCVRHVRSRSTRDVPGSWQPQAVPSTLERWALWINVPASWPLPRTVLKCPLHHLPEVLREVEPHLPTKVTSSLTRLQFSLPCLTSHFLIILPEVVSQINHLHPGSSSCYLSASNFIICSTSSAQFLAVSIFIFLHEFGIFFPGWRSLDVLKN